MERLNLINDQEKEKLEKISKLFWKAVIIIFSSGFTGIMLCIFLEIITSGWRIAKFFDGLMETIFLIMMLSLAILFLPYWIYAFYKGFFSSQKLPNKILVTNNLAEISTNKSNEPKYTEKDVITIVNGLIRNSNNPEKGNLAAATFYASTINNDDSLTSSSWGNQQNWRTSTASSPSKLSSIYSNWDTGIGSSSSPRCHYDYSDSNRRIRDYYHDCYCSPSHPMYKIYHST